MGVQFKRLLVVRFLVTRFALAFRSRHLFGGWNRLRKARKPTEWSGLPSDRGTWAISNAAKRRSLCEALSVKVADTVWRVNLANGSW
ncbi:hypothetical protein BDM02DRAFT_3113450 [Thelephora ganbajun]|uniref:Uncharacterized protein n=1 Tax=Thelephora ganbajun TaxID=370292 RepID=A0ACB6ZJ84_THEGA|nr:hypothetical protein BDM02DRAFT_3113450 [Thelephora ganbajun]